MTFGGRDWRTDPDLARQMFDVFGVMRQLYELLWNLTRATRLRPAAPIRASISALAADTAWLTELDAADLLRLDLSAHRAKAGVLLRRVGELVSGDVLSAVAACAPDPCTAADLGRQTGLDPQSVQAVLSRLQRDGAIGARPSVDGGAAGYLLVTPGGRRPSDPDPDDQQRSGLLLGDDGTRLFGTDRP